MPLSEFAQAAIACFAVFIVLCPCLSFFIIWLSSRMGTPGGKFNPGSFDTQDSGDSEGIEVFHESYPADREDIESQKNNAAEQLEPSMVDKLREAPAQLYEFGQSFFDLYTQANKPSGDATDAPADAASPSGDATDPPADVASPTGDAASPPVDATSPTPTVVATSPAGDATILSMEEEMQSVAMSV